MNSKGVKKKWPSEYIIQCNVPVIMKNNLKIDGPRELQEKIQQYQQYITSTILINIALRNNKHFVAY